MTWVLLFGLTLLVVLLPMLPAMAEWRWPKDVTPLHIDTQDALDPPFLACSFAARLAAAVTAGQAKLGPLPIAHVLPGERWPLQASEGHAALSHRVWHAAGDAELPPATSFSAQVAATGNLRSAQRSVYGGLWAGHHLYLAAFSTVLHWAHGAQVDVQPGCLLRGRISADESITVHGAVAFALLHAPTVRFAHLAGGHNGAARSKPTIFPPGLPAPVVWDSVAGRGTSDEALEIGTNQTWNGDLVCASDLWLGAGCHANGSLKARGDIEVGQGCSISGSVFAEGVVRLGPRCNVLGSVVSETKVVLGVGCRVGAPGCPATVAAPRIEVAPGVVVHGTLWADESGGLTIDRAEPQPAPVRFAAVSPVTPAFELAGHAVQKGAA